MRLRPSLNEVLIDCWSRDLSVADTLHYCTHYGYAQCIALPHMPIVFGRMDKQYADFQLSMGIICEPAN